MGAFISAIEAIRSRLVAAQATGKKLATVKKVFVGERRFDLIGETCPTIFIEFKGHTDEWDAGMRQKKRANININIVLLYQIFDHDSANLLYSGYGGTTSGLIDLIEKLNDVIFETTGQVISPNLGLNSIKAVGVGSCNLEKLNDGFFAYTIPLDISTANFAINGANS